MKPRRNTRRPLGELVFGYLDGALSAGEVPRLNEALKRNARLRKEFAGLLLQQELLRELGLEER